MWPRQAAKILASGALFLMLGLGGIVLSWLVVPLLILGMPNIPRRQRLVRRVIRQAFRMFTWALRWTGILAVQWKDMPSPSDLRGTLLVANHPSFLDTVLLVAHVEDVVCVAKTAAWRNPCYGLLIRAAGYMPGQDPESTVQKAVEALQSGLTVLVFPEGTRRPTSGPVHFHRGAAHMALLAGAPIQPLLMTVEPPLLSKGDRWYHVPHRTCQFMVRALDRIQPPPFGQIPMPVKARQWTESLESLFSEQLHGCKPFNT